MVAAKNAKKVMRRLKKQEKEEGHPVLTSKLTIGQRAADALTAAAGSWWFIIGLFLFMGAWMAMNVWFLYLGKWDPYPFILLNFILSGLAAIQAPIILMSQNRQADRDRVRAEWDYTINRKAESEIATVLKDVKALKRRLRVR